MLKVNPKKTTIGWIGTGVMGSSMCLHLLKKGYKAVIYTRTKKKAKNLIELGAEWVDSPKLVAEKADVIFTIVGFPKDVRQVYFSENGIFEGIKEGSLIVDMTYEAAMLKECSSVDAPVSGGDIGAQAGNLSIMVGGDKEAVQAVMPLLKLMGGNIVHQGGAGKGQHAKMCNQIMASALMIGMCETLLYGYKAGLNLNTMLSSVGKGAAASWMLDNLAPKTIKRDFEPGFYVEHFIKDMGIALKEAERMNLSLPKGTQALLLALEKISDVK